MERSVRIRFGWPLLQLVLFAATCVVLSQAATAQTLIDVAKGNADAPGAMIVYDGRLFFGFDDGTHGEELWYYDAGTGRTGLVTDACPGSCGSDFSYLVPYDGKLFFTARDRQWGSSDLWYYDAATDQARLAVEFEDEVSSIQPFESPVVYDDRLFFSAYSPEMQDGWLWYYDASTGEALPFGSPDPSRPGFRPSNLTVFGEYLYFTSQTERGRRLFRYNARRGAIDGPIDDVRDPGYFAAHEGRLFFTGSRPGHGVELLALDTTNGRVQPAAGMMHVSTANPVLPLGSHAGELYLSIHDDERGRELFAYASSAATARLVGDICPGRCSSNPGPFVAYDGRLFFTADDGRYGTFPFEWRRTARSLYSYHRATDVLETVAAAPPMEPDARNLIVYDDQLFFGAFDVEQGHELWYHDATTDRAHPAANMSPAEASSAPWAKAIADGTLYFTANDAVHGRDLWAYDDVDGARRIRPDDDRLHWRASNNAPVRARAGTAFFTATDDVYGTELWYSNDGRVARRAADICEGPCSSNAEPFLIHEGTLYLGASDGEHGRELWAYDTATGTATLAADVHPGPASSSPADAVIFDRRLFFSATDSLHGRELWYYDVHTGRTSLTADLASGTEDSRPHRLTPLDGHLYFRAHDTTSTATLWRYRSRRASPADRIPDAVNGHGRVERVPDLPDMGCDCTRPFLIAYDHELFFRAYDDAHGGEIWSYDPHARRSRLIADLASGTSNSVPRDALVYDDKLFFNAYDGDNSSALWYYDRRAKSTRLLADVLADMPAVATKLFDAGNRLYMDGSHPQYGRELWYVTPYDLRRNAPTGQTPALGNAPNPFHQQTEIHYVLLERAHVRIDVYDILGRRVTTLVDDEQGEGMHFATLDATDLAPGVYVCRFYIADDVVSHPMVRVR